MLDPARYPYAQGLSASPRPSFHMQDSDRMAGSVPVWSNGGNGGYAAAPGGGTDGLNYAPAAIGAQNSGTESAPFGFYDLLDMVNPLQHIPIVSSVYREVTGDTIKPVSRVIGGAIFGGPAGAAGGLANVIIEEETGRDFAGNVVAMVRDGETPHYRPTPRSVDSGPEQALNSALQIAQADNPALLPADATLAQASNEDAARQDLPPQTLAFADMGAAHRATPPHRLHEISSRYND